MLGLNGKLLDFIYPVGSYYETSDTSFNPNTAWGGTWLEDTKGRVTVALDSEDTDFDTINEIGGSKELQEHVHKSLFYQVRDGGSSGNGGGTYGNRPMLKGNNASNVTTLWDGTSSGTGDSGNLQPYVVVKRWHRTA